MDSVAWIDIWIYGYEDKYMQSSLSFYIRYRLSILESEGSELDLFLVHELIDLFMFSAQ